VNAKIIDGNALAAKIRQELKEKVNQRVAQNLSRPGIAVILVGEDPASMVYVRNKHQDCESVGFYSEVIRPDVDISEQALLDLIASLNEREDIDGILVQLPLPDHINTDKVIEAIDPAKDVDGFHPFNVGRLMVRQPLMRPCTPKGIMHLLDQTGVSLSGLDAVVIGQSNIVGRPMAIELLSAGCTVTICHSRTRNLKEKCLQADIVVSAVGRSEMVQGDWIKPGAIVIDVGINRCADGTLVGDVQYKEAAQRAAWITPVPGGVGPMTRACLLENTLLAVERRG
jgi:methylenetetrahydrofolate dehydrogenase (NADP+)/methenyltetrahydrofolate cyclohydrolase